jgi:3-hydroxyacyl-[acyl-carrier-protein] dehydratase
MLLNNFFKINTMEISADKISADVQVILNPKHSIYEGHFPGNPIVPGVCMIQMTKEILSEILKQDFLLVKSSAIKLNNLINPMNNQIINFDFKIKYIDEKIVSVRCLIYFENTNFCNFKGEFCII